MLYYALVFLIVAIIAGVLGFGGIRFGGNCAGPVLPVPHIPRDLARSGSHPANVSLQAGLAARKLVPNDKGWSSRLHPFPVAV